MPGISGKQLAGDLINFVFGSFKSQFNAGALTANRFVIVPDKSGTARISEFPSTFTSVVPFQGDTSYPTQTVNSVINFTLGTGSKSACARTIYRLIADGTNAPTFTGFLETGDSLGYYNSNGILNIIEFFWDGVSAWYKITQQKYAMPSTAVVGISFPLRTSTAVINSTNSSIYESTTAEGTLYASNMVSAQTIPSGKYGRITVQSYPNMILGLKTSGSLEDYTKFNYSVFGYLGKAYTIGSPGGSSVDSGITIGTGLRYYRLTRYGNGLVTAETSPDNITWTLMTNFGTTFTGTFYVGIALSGNQNNRYLQIISFELEM